MKKLLSFLFLLFIPFIVNAADVEIKSITLIKKTGDVVINKAPTYSGLKINFDLAFTNVDDAVEYKVVIKNISDEDLEIDDDPQYGNNKYIKYDATFKDGTNIIKKGTEKEIDIVVSYANEIPTEEFDNGVYNEKGSVSISFLNNKENPKTSTYIPIAIIGTAVLAIAVYLLAKHNMKKGAVLLVVMSLTALPIIGIALRQVSFDIESKIYIQDRCYTLDTEFGSFDDNDTKSICVPFSENKYVHQDYVFMLTPEPRHDTDKVYISVIKTHMTQNSYVKVYDQNNKLLKEITLKDFRKPIINVLTGINYGEYRKEVLIGKYNKEDLRIELSEDLQNINQYDIAYFSYGADAKPSEIKGPWITDPESITKITKLRSYGTIAYGLLGFERDAKDTHLYHAVWGEIKK